MPSGRPMPTHSEYSVSIRLTQWHHPTNIGYAVRLINADTHRIFSRYPADPTASTNEYGYAIRLTNAYTHQIFSWYPANQMTSTNKYWICHQPMPTHTEYFVSIRLTQQHHPTNIGYAIRLTNAYTYWIFCLYLANPTAPSNQYWICRQANQCQHTLNILSVSG